MRVSETIYAGQGLGGGTFLKTRCCFSPREPSKTHRLCTTRVTNHDDIGVRHER